MCWVSGHTQPRCWSCEACALTKKKTCCCIMGRYVADVIVDAMWLPSIFIWLCYLIWLTHIWKYIFQIWQTPWLHIYSVRVVQHPELLNSQKYRPTVFFRNSDTSMTQLLQLWAFPRKRINNNGNSRTPWVCKLWCLVLISSFEIGFKRESPNRTNAARCWDYIATRDHISDSLSLQVSLRAVAVTSLRKVTIYEDVVSPTGMAAQPFI